MAKVKIKMKEEEKIAGIRLYQAGALKGPQFLNSSQQDGVPPVVLVTKNYNIGDMINIKERRRQKFLATTRKLQTKLFETKAIGQTTNIQFNPLRTMC